MLTVRQIERLWDAGKFHDMVRLFLEMRPENSVRLVSQLSNKLPAAALAVIRLDELSQSFHPFSAKMVRTILADQEADGGFGDPMVTALCLRALLCGNGRGPAVDRAIEYLANLQKPEGLWPRIPMRRMPADPFVSAFVLLQLGEDERFGHSNRVGDAADWFDAQRQSLDAETARLWRSLSIRIARQVPAATWS